MKVINPPYNHDSKPMGWGVICETNFYKFFHATSQHFSTCSQKICSRKNYTEHKVGYLRVKLVKNIPHHPNRIIEKHVFKTGLGERRNMHTRALRYGFFHCRLDMIFLKMLRRFRYDLDNLTNPLHDLDTIPIFLQPLKRSRFDIGFSAYPLDDLDIVHSWHDLSRFRFSRSPGDFKAHCFMSTVRMVKKQGRTKGLMKC